MKTSSKVELICKTCGKKYEVIKARATTSKFCSKKCSSIGLIKEPNVKCTECGKDFRVRPDRMKRKRIFGFFCSNNCAADFKRKAYLGDKNPNYKAVFKDCYGYPLQYIPQIGRVKEHVYVTLNYLGIKSIPKGYYVHHRDCNVFNNIPENLALLTISDHQFIHKNFGNASLWALQNNKITIDDLCSWSREPEKSRKILETNLTNQIAVFKQGELLETPEKDNQQPSLDSNILEGSTTNSRVQTDNAEDSNADTSALHLYLTRKGRFCVSGKLMI